MADALSMDSSATVASVTTRSVSIAADDSTSLAATLFEPAGHIPADTPAIAIGPAAAVPSRYYRHFAAYLAERGHHVLTFDYRGIGGSRTGSLKGSRTTMRDWCVLDTPGVIAWASDHFSGRPLYWVGHSMGGFAPGLSHNNARIARQLNIATLSGYWGRMASPERWRVKLLMGYVSPWIVWTMGYLPGMFLGGEDMPPQAYLQWARWCMQREFLFADPSMIEVEHLQHFRAPIRFAQIEDDPWGTPAAVEHMASHFTANVERSMWPIRLADAGPGTKRIGHLGFFRPEFRETLWAKAYCWLAG